MTLANVVLQGPSAKFEAEPELKNRLQNFSFYDKEVIDTNKCIRDNFRSNKESVEKRKKEIENKYKEEVKPNISDLSLGQLLEESDPFVGATYKLLMSGLKGFFKSLDVSKIDYDEKSNYDLTMFNHSLNVLPFLRLSQENNLSDIKEIISTDLMRYYHDIERMLENMSRGKNKFKAEYSTSKEGYINLCNLASNGKKDEFEKEAFETLVHFSLNYNDYRKERYEQIYDSLKRKFSDKVINERLNEKLKSDKSHLELVSHIEKLDHSIDDYNNRLSENTLDVVDDKYKMFGYNLEFALQRVTSLEEGTVIYKGKIKIEGEPESMKMMERMFYKHGDPESMKMMERMFYKHGDEPKRELLERLKSEKIGQVEDCGKINVEIDTSHHGIVLDYKIKMPNIPTQEETSKIILNTKNFFERGTEESMNLVRYF